MTAPPDTLRKRILEAPRGLYLAGALAWMAGIFVLSGMRIHLPESGYPRLWSFLVNFFHFPLYAGLGALLLLGLRSGGGEGTPRLGRRAVISALAVLALYGAFDEIHQSFTGRTPSVLDFLVDCCGGGAAMAVLRFHLEEGLERRRFLALLGLLVLAAALFAA